MVRSDLSAGLQIAQACHVTRQFTEKYPLSDVGDCLVVLQVPDEATLKAIYDRVPYSMEHCGFHEPDLGYSLTAVALSGEAKPLLRKLPLALCPTAA